MRLPYCLLKDTVKRHFFGIYLIMFLEVRNFGNILAMSVFFFFDYVQNIIQISEMEKKFEKIIFSFVIIAYE